MATDLRVAIRSLRRSPVFTASAVLSLALGIGANTAIFSLLNDVVLRSLPVPDPQSLVAFKGSYSGPGDRSSAWSTNSGSVFPYPFYRDLRDGAPALAGIVARAITPARATWQGNTQEIEAEMVSGNYFRALGVNAMFGRAIAPEDDDAPGKHPVAVLSHGFWMTKLGGDRTVLNRTIAINGYPFVIVGVARAGFHGLVQGDSPDLFVPATMQRIVAPIGPDLEDRTASWLNLFGRLDRGQSIARAQAALDVAVDAIREADRKAAPAPANPKGPDAHPRIQLLAAAQGIAELRDRWEKPIAVLMIMVGLVLLIACANVAGLLATRATGRQRDFAIRISLGGNRRQLARALLVEGFVLAAAGSIAAMFVARWSVAGLLRMLPRDTVGDWISGSLDARALVYTVVVSILSALLFATIPALQATRPDVSAMLKDQSSGALSGGRPARLRRVLVAAQLALSLVLVVGAGLFTATAANLVNASRGFRTERLWIFNVDATLVRNGGAATKLYHDLLDRLSALPGVRGAAASDSGPYAGAGYGSGIRIEGYRGADGRDVATGSVETVSPGYFQALGAALRAGREFNDRDTASAPRSAVVSDAFVNKYMPNQNPIGRHVAIGGPKDPLDREIVGVVADVRGNVRRAAGPKVYFPYEQRDRPARMAFYVRAGRDDAGLAEAIRRAVRETDGGLPVPEIKPVELRIRESIYTERLVSVLAAAFGALATLLAAIGLYGVIALAVARRTPEIGVRMAIGAVPGDVVKMVLADAARMVVPGIAIGLAGALALSRAVRSQLYGVEPASAAVYAAAAAALVVVAAVAAAVPAWKASRIDPVSALRYQ